MGLPHWISAAAPYFFFLVFMEKVSVKMRNREKTSKNLKKGLPSGNRVCYTIYTKSFGRCENDALPERIIAERAGICLPGKGYNTMRIGFTEILVILAVALVVLGPEKLPLYMKKFGQAMRELKKYSSELTEDLKENVIAPLDEAQRPLREAMEPLENLDKELKANAKDLENSFRDIGKPKKPEETPKEDPAEKAMEAPETAAAAEEPAAETQKESTNNTQEEL